MTRVGVAMGLDSVELVMALEEQFGVSFTDEEYTRCRTPGNLIDVLCAKFQKTEEQFCLSQGAFYILRRTCMQQFNTPRQTITPDTPLQEFFPIANCRKPWEELQQAVLARTWPLLLRPLWLSMLLAIIIGVVFGATFFKCWTLDFGMIGSISTAIFIAVLISLLSFWITIPLQRVLPREIRKIRDIIPFVSTSRKIKNKWNRTHIAQLVRVIVIEQLGLAESAYREDADLVSDLGMN
jgi:hypothetical protein